MPDVRPQALFGLNPADPQGQRWRPGAFTQSPVQCRTVKQDQPGVALQLARARQLRHGLEAYLVLRRRFSRAAAKLRMPG